MPERRRGWEQKDIQFIKDNYGVLSLHELSSRLSRSYSSISSKIYKLGLDDPRCWSKEEDLILVQNYEYNPVVWNLLPNRSRAAITLRADKVFKLSRKCGKYPVNYKFFDTITSESAYVLGFFTADGCLEPKKHGFSFSQRIEDVDVLYKIRKVMDCRNPLCFKRTRNEVTLFVTNQYMQKCLESMGYDNQKSISADIPDQITYQFYPDFIRGLIDGDGSVICKNGNIDIQLLGTLKVLSKIREYFISMGLSSKSHVSKRQINVHVLKYSKYDSIKICDLIYSGKEDLSMARKYKKAMEILGIQNGAFARGVTPGIINSAQNEEILPSNVEDNLVRKTEKSDWRVETESRSSLLEREG